jgi:hypothetical protein
VANPGQLSAAFNTLITGKDIIASAAIQRVIAIAAVKLIGVAVAQNAVIKIAAKDSFNA